MMLLKRLILLYMVVGLAACVTTERNHRLPPTSSDSNPSSTQPLPEPPPRPVDRDHAPASRQPTQPTQTTQTTQSEPERKPPPRTAAEVSSPAVRSLLGRADTLARAGRMDMAAATLERALDLEPRNPFIYQQLASVRLAEGQVGQAEAMARKSNSVAGDNPFVRASNWRLIAEARRTDGDDSGAQKATAKAANYRSTSSRMAQ